MRFIALLALVSIMALCAAPALALPTVDELIERAERFAAEAKQYTCRVSIEDAAGSAAGRLRARENKFQLELERKDGAGALLGMESWIFDGETIWMAMRPGGRPIPTVIKMEVKRIEEHARRIDDDVRLERLDRGVNPFTAISSLRRDFDLSVIEEIRDRAGDGGGAAEADRRTPADLDRRADDPAAGRSKPGDSISRRTL